MISYDRLHELLNYNEKTGVFNWKVTRSGNAKAGSEAGCLQPSGYIRIGIDRKDYQAHRLAWLYVYGYFPENGIDHKDQIKHHNMIDNLREANKSCNMKNSKPIRADNTSGIKGVGWSKASKKWRAWIKINCKYIHLGYFVSKLDAAIARHDAEIKHNWDVCNTKASSAYNFISNYKGDT